MNKTSQRAERETLAGLQPDVKFHWPPRLCVNRRASIRVRKKTLMRHWYSLRAKAFRSRRIISEKRHYEPRARDLVCNESIGIPSVTRGTLLHSQGIPLKVAQAQLGQSHMATTLDIYTHASGSAQRDAVNLLEEQLFPNVPKLESCGSIAETESQLVQ